MTGTFFILMIILRRPFWNTILPMTLCLVVSTRRGGLSSDTWINLGWTIVRAVFLIGLNLSRCLQRLMTEEWLTNRVMNGALGDPQTLTGAFTRLTHLRPATTTLLVILMVLLRLRAIKTSATLSPIITL